MSRRLFAFILLSVLAACSGDDSDGTGPNGEFRLSARIDGATWGSNAGAEAAGVSYSVPGLYVISGTQIGGYTIIISLYNIGGTGSYPLGVGPSVPGGSVVLSSTTGTWATTLSGAAGTINITTLTATQIAGTFDFTVNAFTGTPAGTKTVTEGQFDLQVKATGTVAALPANAGSKVSATIGGSAWNAATVSGNLSTGQTLYVLTASNTTRSITITLGGINGPGTYTLSNSGPTRTISATGVTTPIQAWSSVAAGSTGSVTITSITSTRIQGTFTATIGPAPGFPSSGTLAIVSGTFSHGFLTPPT